MTELKVIFTISGDALNADTLTNISKITPTSYGYKGDIIPHRTDLTWKDSFWSYDVGLLMTYDVEILTKSFQEIFQPVSDILADYIAENQLTSKLDIVVKMEGDETPALYFDTDLLTFLVKLNGRIDIDMYNQ
jgi:hypothetical protein